MPTGNKSICVCIFMRGALRMIPAVFHPGIPRSWRHMVSWGSSLALEGMVRVDLMEVTHIFHEAHTQLLWLGVVPADLSFLRAVVPRLFGFPHSSVSKSA